MRGKRGKGRDGGEEERGKRKKIHDGKRRG
jgi:hypothetical protein